MMARRRTKGYRALGDCRALKADLGLVVASLGVSPRLLSRPSAVAFNDVMTTAHKGMFVKTLGLQCCFGLERHANMAPKRCYDAARLGMAAEEAEKRPQKLFGCDLVCK